MKIFIFWGMLIILPLGFCQWHPLGHDFESLNDITEENVKNGLGFHNVYENQVMVDSCTIQRGISPNGDGLNDYFDLTGHKVKKLTISDRCNGMELYSQTNYTNEWGGQDNDGNKLATGTYFYCIDNKNGEQSTGWVYINREL